MGASSSGTGCKAAACLDEASVAELPIFFAEILAVLGRFERELGGVKNFTGRPRIEKKVKAKEFVDNYTDFEYAYLTVLGFAQLHMSCEEIVRKNNGRPFHQNPGVQLLEQRTGMTMHADREGSEFLLRTAPATLVEAFGKAKSHGDGKELLRFFRQAFDRTADPCLEGRAGRIMEYLNSRAVQAGPSAGPPWEDVSLRPLPKTAAPREIVGEHLRVFVNECTWRWAQEKGLPYDDAKVAKDAAKGGSDFSRLYNAASFRGAMAARGVVTSSGGGASQWEVQVDGSQWSAYDDDQNDVITRAQAQNLPRCEIRINRFKYEIDLVRSVQRNVKTGKERPIRCVESSGSQRAGKVTSEQLEAAISLFIKLDTLPAAPNAS